MEAAQASKLVDLVVVSSDDDDILLAAQSAGAVAHKRSEAASNDTAQIEEGIFEFLDFWHGVDIEAIVILQPTSPQREAWQIDEAIQMLSTADSVVGVVPSHALQWARNGNPRPMFNRGARPRRQDMDTTYEECGSLYITRVRTLKVTGVRSGGEVALYVMGPADRYQIDDRFDLAVVVGILETRHLSLP